MLDYRLTPIGGDLYQPVHKGAVRLPRVFRAKSHLFIGLRVLELSFESQPIRISRRTGGIDYDHVTETVEPDLAELICALVKPHKTCPGVWLAVEGPGVAELKKLPIQNQLILIMTKDRMLLILLPWDHIFSIPSSYD